ncbi:MAG: helix-turn-helix domain-containing protein [Chloroflexi bacterium]|nr:helix-turn-helix domain-containing protein [Chloroflexota bacterium]
MTAPRSHNNEISHINLLTIQEVATWAKVSTKTVYRWIANKKLPAIRLGSRTYRISEHDLLEYLKNAGYYALVD